MRKMMMHNEKAYYMVSLRPRFRMPKEMVDKFKARGYKWIKRDGWVLEKIDCTSEAEEKEFIMSFGEQQWEFSIMPDVGKYDEMCEQCGYKKTITVYDPLLFSALVPLAECPECKNYSLKVKNIKTNERYREWKKEAEKAAETFIESMKETLDEM